MDDDLTPNQIVQNNIVRFDPIVHTIVPPPLDPSLITPGMHAMPKTVKPQEKNATKAAHGSHKA